jgi:hypothetical protein
VDDGWWIAKAMNNSFVRQEVSELVGLGPLPSYVVAMRDDYRQRLEKYAFLIASIQKPVTNKEAQILAGLFGPDDCFGLEWVLVSLIETAPSWPLENCIPADSENEWIQMLRQRIENGRQP